MAQVILIEDDKNLNALISINLKNYLNVDLIQRDNAHDTLSLLSILPNVDLIITTTKIMDEPTVEILNNYIIVNKLEIGLIVLGGTPVENQKSANDNTVWIQNPKDWEQIIVASAKILGITKNVLAQNVIPDYIPIPVKYFLHLEHVNCDVFIRIKKSPTEYQFVKRIHNSDSCSNESIQRYLKQGLEHFYITKDSYKHFTIFLSNILVDKMDAPNMDIVQKIQLMGEAYDIAIKEISNLGFQSETIQLMESIIQNMVKNFEKSPGMSSLLHKVINSSTGFLFQHCHMISVVASEIMKNLELNDYSSYYKIAYASFFHDITLADHEEFSKIISFDELEKTDLGEHTEENWEMIFNHAFDASLLIRRHHEAPEGADEIIKHHHGAFNGRGFSSSIDNFSMISKTFIVAHYFVVELMRFKETGGEARPLIEKLYQRYPGPEVASIIVALEKTLKKKN